METKGELLIRLRDRAGEFLVLRLQGVLISDEDRLAADLLLYIAKTQPTSNEPWEDDVIERAAFLMEYVVIQKRSDEMAWKPTEADFQAWELIQYLRDVLQRRHGERPTPLFILKTLLAALWWKKLLDIYVGES